jgi:hypothetical protein
MSLLLGHSRGRATWIAHPGKFTRRIARPCSTPEVLGEHAQTMNSRNHSL